MQKAKVCFKQPEEKAEALCRQVKLYKVTLLEQRQDRSTHIQGPEKDFGHCVLVCLVASALIRSHHATLPEDRSSRIFLSWIFPANLLGFFCSKVFLSKNHVVFQLLFTF